jgi:hypothetical protein
MTAPTSLHTRQEIQQDIDQLMENLQRTLDSPLIVQHAEHLRYEYVWRTMQEIARLERLLENTA